MRRIIIILLATITFVACNNDDGIDYSLLTLEEIATTNGGWDYLETHYEAFDYEQFVAMMTTGYFTVDCNEYVLTDKRWNHYLAIGTVTRHFTWLDAGTMRECYYLPEYMSEDFQSYYYYKDFAVTDKNWLHAVVNAKGENSRVIGLYKDEAILIEYENYYGQIIRVICRIHKEGQEELLSLYTTPRE